MTSTINLEEGDGGGEASSMKCPSCIPSRLVSFRLTQREQRRRRGQKICSGQTKVVGGAVAVVAGGDILAVLSGRVSLSLSVQLSIAT